MSYTILMIFHVFVSNILFINYLIAILSNTYAVMQDSGTFSYKVNLYQYCERYMIAFNDPGYGEMVLHPPPVSYAASILIPFSISSKMITPLARCFSYLVFWCENCLLILAFGLIEMMLMPFTYLKIWWNIGKGSLGILSTLLNSMIWALFGIPLCIFLIFRDLFYLIRLLCYHQGCRAGRHEDHL